MKLSPSELRQKKIVCAKAVFAEIYNSKHGTDFPPIISDDQLAIITLDYMRDRDAYRRELGRILARAPEEAYVGRNPTPASNRKAILETFESTLFSSFVARMPPRYQAAYKALKPYQRNITGFCMHMANGNEDLQRVLADIESVAAVGSNVNLDPVPHWGSSVTCEAPADIFVDAACPCPKLEEPAVHLREPDREWEKFCFSVDTELSEYEVRVPQNV